MLSLFLMTKKHESWENESLLKNDFLHIAKRSWWHCFVIIIVVVIAAVVLVLIVDIFCQCEQLSAKDKHCYLSI